MLNMRGKWLEKIQFAIQEEKEDSPVDDTVHEMLSQNRNSLQWIVLQLLQEDRESAACKENLRGELSCQSLSHVFIVGLL